MPNKRKKKRAVQPTNLTELASGFRQRTLTTARLATRLGLKLVKKNLGMQAMAAEIDEAAAVKAAQRILAELDGLKGLVMKFGQMASYLSGSLPPKAQQVLAQLQSQSQPMSFTSIKTVFREEFGADPAELFDSFDTSPFAAASIGQVHHATLKGKRLAVKVQYPRIRELLNQDLKTIGRMMRLGTLLSAVDGAAMAQELAARVEEETDYLGEARNQTLFGKLMSPWPEAHVPAVLAHLTTSRILTTEFCTGRDFNTFAQQATQQERNRAGITIFDVCFSCIFNRCIYNADPHPGNYLFPEADGVVFLDFGCVKHFAPDLIDTWKHLARVVTDGRRVDFEDAYCAAGFVGNVKRFDFDYQWNMMQYLYAPFTSRIPFTFTHEYVKQSYDILMFTNPNRFRMNLPADWLFVNRLQWGLNSVLAHLQATADWGELWRAAIESPTEPLAFGPV